MSYSRYPEYRDSGVEWLGEVPSGWKVGVIKRKWKVVDCKHLTATFVPKGIPLASIGEVRGWYVNLSNAKQTTESDYLALIGGGRKPLPGDILFTRNATVGECCLVPDRVKFAMGQDVCLIQKLGDFSSSFLLHLLKSPVAKLQLDQLMVGSTFKRVNVEDIRNISIPLPPLPEQRQIAAFLDRECAAMDSLILKQERLISLLKEKRQALISHTVTKGLDPQAKLKDSGIEWLGQVPEGWVVSRIKFSVNNFEQGWSPQCEGRLRDEEEFGVLKVGCVNTGSFNAREHKALPDSLVPQTQYRLKGGDLLISRANTRDLVGKAAIVDRDYDNLLLCDKLYRLRFIEGAVPEFFRDFLLSDVGREQIELDATGASASMVNIGQSCIKEMHIPLPPLPEQRAIVAYLDEACGKIDTLVAKAESAITLLKERRTALISAAVTGKIDVREL